MPWGTSSRGGAKLLDRLAIATKTPIAHGQDAARFLTFTALSVTVPAAGDYQINFSTASTAPQVSYTAQVTIPPGGGPTTPTRIQFAPGTSVAQLNDVLAAGGDTNRYVLSVGAGQTISVGVFASPPAVTAIAIRDGAGTLISSGTDMSGLSGPAPATGDYFIDVSNAGGAPAVSYLLTVSVPPLSGDTPQPIEFGPGQTSATVNGDRCCPAAGGPAAAGSCRAIGSPTTRVSPSWAMISSSTPLASAS